MALCRPLLLTLALVALSVLVAAVYLTPGAAASAVGVCIRNCAQCKKMFGPYFEGQLCGDACLKFKGKMVPDCEDAASIAPFLSKLE
nr:eclosion hormone 1 [Schistocerca gregaria]